MRERARERERRERAREREIEREKERERERKRERERERERPDTTLHLDGESLTKRQKSGKKIYQTIFVDSCHIALGFSRESPAGDMWYYVAFVYNGELVPLMGNQRVGIFPPKSKILYVLSLALIWCRNFHDWIIPVGGDTWTSCTSERRIRTRYT